MGTGGHPFRAWFIPLGLVSAACLLISPTRALVRGVCPLGMYATNSGVTHESCFTYSNVILFTRAAS
jgi:hypothetical protein